MSKSGFYLLIVLLFMVCSLKSQEQINDTIVSANPVNLSENSIQNPKALTRAFQRLNSIKNGSDSTFVVVHFGDSHIQIGYFSGAFERNLKLTFGDAGYGVLFPYSACKSIGPYNFKANFNGVWDYNNVTSHPTKIPIGIKGYALRTNDSNSAFGFRYVKNEDYLVQSATIFHGPNNYQLVQTTPLGDSVLQSENLSLNWDITKILVSAENPEFSFKLKKTSNLQSEFLFNGVMFEGTQKKGVQYHHCGVVGAHFFQISKNNSLLIPQLIYLHPDLIIFSYGSNETYLPEFDSIGYFKEISKFIEQIKKEIPGVEVLITLAPDTKSNNRRPVHKKAINRTLERIALKTNAAYWNLNAVMGGDNSMIKWKTNGLAQKDKLHFFKSGYCLQGDLMSLAFFNAFNKIYPNALETDSLLSVLNKEMKVFTISVEEDVTSKKQQTYENNRHTHIVKKGDTLSSLARKYNCSVGAIKKANKINSSVIKIGETLHIP